MRQHTVLACSMSIAFLFGCGAAVDDGAGDEHEATAAEQGITFDNSTAIAIPGAAWTASPAVSPPVGGTTSPPVLAHEYADLALVGAPISFTDISGNDTYVSIEVTNVGNASTRAAPGTVRFANYGLPTNLYSKQGGTSIPAGGQGSVTFFVPDSVAQQCRQHTVALDIDQDWQFDNFGGNVFANDQADLTAPCLTWTSPITQANLGTKPDAWVLNKSLESIVSSFERGSKLGYCSHCHYQNSGRPYSPDVQKDDEQWIWDNQVIDDWRWAGPGGWAVRFSAIPGKPEGLKKVMRKWIANGFPR